MGKKRLITPHHFPLSFLTSLFPTDHPYLLIHVPSRLPPPSKEPYDSRTYTGSEKGANPCLNSPRRSILIIRVHSLTPLFIFGLSSFFVFALSLTIDLAKIRRVEKSKSKNEQEPERGKKGRKSLIAYLPIAVKTMIVLGDSKGY